MAKAKKFWRQSNFSDSPWQLSDSYDFFIWDNVSSWLANFFFL
jgi:hypothetical protein